MDEKPRFIPVDLDANSDICVKFTTDAYICSFGDAQRFLSGSHHYLKPKEYLEWLKAKLESAPNSVVHVWVKNEIIGQLELGFDRHDPKIGYVHLYYLVPHMRGKGLSKSLDEYSCAYLRQAGFFKARLSVTKTNDRAKAFYRKMGWKEQAPSQSDPDVVIMEKNLVSLTDARIE